MKVLEIEYDIGGGTLNRLASDNSDKMDALKTGRFNRK
jgi:hypothetical protein